MADEIINKLGFDASEAIAALTRLDSACQSIEQRLANMATSMQQFNASSGPMVSTLKLVATNASSAASAVAKLSSAYQKASQQAPPTPPAVPTVPAGPNPAPGILAAKSATDKWVVSWETLARVVSTQLIVRALSQIRNALDEAYESNVQFVRSLSLIQTIAPEQQLNGLAATVRKTSDSLNLDILDVSRGLYDVVSQQVEGAKAQERVITSSGKFAKVTGSGIAESVQVLTSTVHAYQMSMEEVDSIAAKFFKTFDIGNVKAQDFVTSFGRVAPVASQVGVSLDEALAAYSTLTRQGVRASEAATQIAASITAFIKPSEGMQKALKQLGYATGADAIRAEGYVGAMERIIGTTDRTEASIGKLFPNVRALRDVFGLTGEKAKEFYRDLSQIADVDPGTIGAKFDQVMDTSAEKASAAVNRLKNIITVDLGEQVVAAVAKGLEVVGVENIALVIQAIVPVATTAAVAVGVLGAALLLYSSRLKLATIQTQLFNTSLAGGLALGAGQAVAVGLMAYAAGSAIGDRLVGIQREAQEAYRAIYEKDLEEFRKAQERKAASADKANQEIVRSAEQTLASVRSLYFKQVDSAREQNEDLVAGTKAALNQIIEARSRIATQLRGVAIESGRMITDSITRVAEIEGRLSDVQFSFRLKDTSGLRQVEELSNRALGLAREAAQQMGEALSKEDVQSAQGLFRRAEAFAQQAQSMAASTNSATDLYDAERAVEGVLGAQIDAEQQLQELQSARRDEAAAAAAEEARRVSDLRIYAKQAIESMRLFDKQGAPLAGGDRERQLQVARQNLQGFFDKAFDSEAKWQVSDLLNFVGLQQRLQTELDSVGAEAEVRLRLAPQVLEDLNRTISEGVGVVEIAAKLAPAGSLPNTFGDLSASEQLGAVSRALDEQRTKVRDLTIERNKQLATEREIAAKTRELSGIFASTETITARLASALNKVNLLHLGNQFKSMQFSGQNQGAEILKEEAKSIERIQAQIKASAEDSGFTLTKYAEFAKSVVLELDRVQSGGRFLETEALGRALLTLKEIAELRSGSTADPAVETKLREAQQALQAVGAQEEAVRASLQGVEQNAAAAAQKAAEVKAPPDAQSSVDAVAGSMSQLAANTAQAVGQMYALAAAAASIQTPGEFSAFGGRAGRYLASGGPVGTDQINTWLSKDEFIVNAASARKFAPQLVAMNAGVQPSYRSHGGSVTNIGDINVTVNGGSSGEQTARAIASQLRRELRRRTSSL